jgi:hypothetical protein
LLGLLRARSIFLTPHFLHFFALSLPSTLVSYPQYKNLHLIYISFIVGFPPLLSRVSQQTRSPPFSTKSSLSSTIKMIDESKLDFIMLALRYADPITIDWKGVAAEQGIKRHDNA